MCLKGVLFRSPYFYAIKIVKKDLILDKVLKEYISKYNSLDNPILKDIVQDKNYYTVILPLGEGLSLSYKLSH